MPHHRHDRIRQQHQDLTRKLRGHYGYYGITHNARGLAAFWRGTERAWQHWLARRSQRAKITWARFRQLLAAFPLPAPTVVHSIYHAAKP